jgi:hypothetical protein
VVSQEKANAVCAKVAEGLSLRKACEAEGMTHPTFLRWCDEDKALADQYARARATGTDAEFEALNELQDMEPQTGPSGTVDAGWVAWKRLQVDTKKWELSKKAPKKYGDKVELAGGLELGVRRIERVIRDTGD